MNKPLTYEQKRAIYEHVMKNMSKYVKQRINEGFIDDANEYNELVEEGWKEAIVAGALAIASIFISPDSAYAKKVTGPGATKAKTEFAVVDRAPQFPGGNEALTEFLRSNVKYPVEAEEKGIEGRVVLSVLIGKDGSVSNVHVVKSVDPTLDKEALRVVRLMPKWIPGKKNGRATQERYTIPFTFFLEKNNQRALK